MPGPDQLRAHKRDYMRSYSTRMKAEGRCVSCGAPAVTASHCAIHAEQTNRNARAKHARLRDEAIEAFGGRCACCGETDRAFLTIDHVEGGGTRERKLRNAFGRMLYRELKRLGYPTSFRLLCMNCNFGRHLNGGICPHTAKVSTCLASIS
jgi:hypothetical protein